jgi:hypothetical protein
MLYPDTDINRQLARDRQAELKRDWEWANPARPDVVESRRRRRWELRGLRIFLRPAGYRP